MLVRLLIIFILFVSHTALAQIRPSNLLNHVKTFEVTACKPSENNIVSAWMEERPSRKDPKSLNAQIGYRFSGNNGKEWTEKRIIDSPGTLTAGNPYLAHNVQGETFLACMHVNMDFFSGNISLYEFDFKSKHFYPRSVVVKSDSTLLDKPSMVLIGEEIHLVYVEYFRSLRNVLRYVISKDKGVSWTKPVTISVDKNVDYLGASIALISDDQILVSCGSYWKNNIYLFRNRKDIDSISFEKPRIVCKVSDVLVNAMSELTSDRKNRLILSWQNNHLPGEVWMSFSTNKGRDWSDPILVTTTGNLLSSTFTKKGRISFIYSDYGNGKFQVNYRSYSKTGKLKNEEKLNAHNPLSDVNEYIGAFQKILYSKGKYYVFWIDYANASVLRFSKL